MGNDRVFVYKEGYLYCENVRITDLNECLKEKLYPSSPCFVYSLAALKNNIEEYHNALETLKIDSVVNFSMKANSTPAILQVVLKMGCSVTLVSGIELKMALRVGFKPELILLNGNAKQCWEKTLAINKGCMINVDSVFDLKQTIEICQQLKTSARVLIRVNPDVDPHVHPYISTGLASSKFGICIEDVEEDLLELLIENNDLIKLVGIHCHLGSTIRDVNVYRCCAEKNLEVIVHLRQNGFNDIKYINIGGGLDINYTTTADETWPARLDGKESTWLSTLERDHREHEEDIRQYQRELISKLELCRRLGVTNESRNQDTVGTVQQLVDAVKPVLDDTGLTLIVEPGRSIIGNTAMLSTRVLGTKRNSKKRFIMIDGAMTEVIRPSLYGAYHHIDLTEPSQRTSDGTKIKNGSPNVDDRKRESMPQKYVYDIVGPVCESSDFLGKDRLLTEPHEGCGLAVFDTGAYCSSMSSNYNMRLRPCEVLVDGDKWHVIRRPDTFEDLLRPFDYVHGVPDI